jgi:toxin HigB-1
MISSFKCTETARIWAGEETRKLPRSIQDRALVKLRQLDASKSLADLAVPPSNRLKALKGERKGQMSIRINDQWRICFKWKDGEARDVEIVDYH